MSSASATRTAAKARRPPTSGTSDALGEALQSPAQCGTLSGAPAGRRGERVGDRPGDEGVDALVKDVDRELVARPGPGRRSGAGQILQRLIETQPQVRVRQRCERT